MKFFITFAALVAVAVATPLHKPSISGYGQLEAILAAINSPSTDATTAGLLKEMLSKLIGADISPVLVEDIEHEPPFAGPAIVEDAPQYEPPFAGPALIDFPVESSPVVIGPIPEGQSPLVQIIVNVAGSASGAGAGAVADAPAGDAVNVVDSIDEPIDIPIIDVPIVDFPEVGELPVSPVEVADLPAQPVSPVEVADLPAQPVSPVEVADLPAQPVSPVEVADLPAQPVAPVQVADLPALPVAPVQIGTPQFPAVPANLPDDLN